MITIGGGSGSISLNDNVTIAADKSLTMTSGTGSLSITGYSGTGNAASITSSSTTDLNKAISISQTGATIGTDYGLYTTNTGAGTTNVGGYFSASGATNNYGLIVESGNVGIGTAAPSSKLTISASGDFAFGDYNAVLVDDMEVITDWTAIDVPNTPVTLESAYVRKGSGAMKITTVAASSNTDTVTKNITAQDWSSYERVGFWIRATQTGQIISAQFSEDDVTYGDDHNITISEANQWQYEEWNISEVADADLNAVLYFRFYIDDDTSSPTFYIDQVRVYDFDERTSEMFVDNDGNLVVWGRGGIELGRGVPGSSLSGMKIGSANIEINQPLNVNVAGDTGMAYDLQFLNTGGANITSQGALTISAGNPNKTQNLTLTNQANQMSGDSGVATAGGAASLTDSSKSWTVDEWIGGTVYIISGTGYGQERTITDSDATSVTVAAWTTNPDTTSFYRLAYLQGGDVIVDIANSSNNYGGFKITGMDNGGYIFRVGPDGNVEIGGNGAAGSNLVVKQNLSLTGGNITVSKLATPANGAAVCGTVASGGLNAGTYYYRVSAINNNGETLALAEFNSGACGAGAGLNKVTVTWDAVSGATGYKVYGRANGAELYMATVSAPNLIYSDTNAIATPAGALPSANTTGGDSTLAGNLTVSGNVGIGTTSPDRKLDVLDASAAQLRLTYSDSSVYTDFTFDTNEDLTISPAENIYFKNSANTGSNLWVCEGAACPAAGTSMGSTGGNLMVEGKIYGGTRCPADMIYVPGVQPFCIDKYEAYNAGGTVVNDTCTNGSQAEVDANTTTAIAGSATGQTPLASLNWCAAKKACQNAGKHLCSNEEWFQSCNYKGSKWSITEEEQSETMACNTANSAPDPHLTGASATCVTQEGALDMIGNVWEWVDKVVTADPTNGLTASNYVTGYDFATGLPTSVGAASTVYGDDYFWAYNGAGAARAFLRGGFWVNGANDGCFTLYLGNAPSNVNTSIGFRCCQ